MAEKMNMKSDQEDESSHVIAERPTLHLDANTGENYKNLPNDWGGKDGREENSNNIKDKPERMVVEGQEEQQGEQNNPEVDNQEPSSVPPNRPQFEYTDRPLYTNFRHSHANLPQHMDMNNRGYNDPSAPPPSVEDRHLQRMVYEHPGMVEGDSFIRPRYSQNIRPPMTPNLNGRPPLMSGERRSVRMPGLSDFGLTTVNFIPDNSAVTQVVNQQLNLAAMNLQCAQQLSGRRSGIPSWAALIGAWRRRVIRRNDMARMPDEAMVARASTSGVTAGEDAANGTPAGVIVNMTTIKAADETMVKWAEDADDNALANHPVLKMALKRGIVERTAAKRMRRCCLPMYSNNMETDMIPYGYVTSTINAKTTMKANADAKDNVDPDATADPDEKAATNANTDEAAKADNDAGKKPPSEDEDIGAEATADPDEEAASNAKTNEVASNAKTDEVAKADNAADDAEKKPPLEDEDDNDGGDSQMPIGLMNHP